LTFFSACLNTCCTDRVTRCLFGFAPLKSQSVTSYIVNYDDKNIKNEILPEYLSLTIIFDDISEENKNELQKLLNLHIANGNRGDIIYIVSKNNK